ncbi:Quinone-oxidoreductase, chloroplastic [Madurella fahalii]|uniref:Quinone-oxidoreductase, chloroplastic n=1 Tax=Madurella fahalii TaxID=1157608 RepID=A0ABQ0G8F3_9PEZI
MSSWPRSFPQPAAKEFLHCIDENNNNADVFTIDDSEWPDADDVISNLPLHIVHVHAVAIHRGEIYPREKGEQPEWMPSDSDEDPCRILGHEFSGVVVSTSPRSPLNPGTEVYGRTSFLRCGCARTYAVATFYELAAKPKAWDWAECAATPMGGLIAFQALFSFPLLVEPTLEEWGLGARTKGYNLTTCLLITGAASPAGILAVQLAKLAGVRRIIGICSAEHIPLVRRMGANVALDWATEGSLKGWESTGGGQFTVVVDFMGGPILTRAWSLVREGGKILSVADDIAAARPARVSSNVQHYNFVLSNCPKQLATIAWLADAGLLRPVLEPDAIYDFSRAVTAMESLREHPRGQVVLRLNSMVSTEKLTVSNSPINVLSVYGRKWDDPNDFDEGLVKLSRGEDGAEEYN